MPETRPEQEWQTFAKDVLPEGCPSIQRIEMKRAFMAGMLVGFNAVVETSTVPEPQCFTAMDVLQDEIQNAVRLAIIGETQGITQ